LEIENKKNRKTFGHSLKILLHMAKFIISKATADGKAWKAEGVNPVTGRKMTIQGGEDMFFI
jgi:hypothetical protein